jgi:D-beta-D-heptose 7-phosphate kinase / D-beta-D-heptose 1-phosphate adenosyltransferase
MDSQKILERKLISLKSAINQCSFMRKIGCKVALCNGCFDGGILTRGHLSVFEHAASKADLVIAAVNTDKSVRRIKGNGRPFFPSRTRKSMVAALHCVHLVIDQEFDNPTILIEKLQPNFLVKGSDTNPSHAVGKGIGQDELNELGCEICYAPQKEGPHTSEILRFLSENHS